MLQSSGGLLLPVLLRKKDEKKLLRLSYVFYFKHLQIFLDRRNELGENVISLVSSFAGACRAKQRLRWYLFQKLRDQFLKYVLAPSTSSPSQFATFCKLLVFLIFWCELEALHYNLKLREHDTFLNLFSVESV